MTTVACVYWKGEFRGRENLYHEEYVAKLQRMVARNLPTPHKFVCLSNTEVPCERIPLKHDWPGYWSKIELFRPGLFEGRVLYLDLDVFVLKDLTPIVEFPSKFVMAAHPDKSRIKEGKHMVCKGRSAIMVWDAGFKNRLYSYFASGPESVMQWYWGDQDYIASAFNYVTTLPGYWAMKIRDCPDFTPTNGMIVAYSQMGKKYPGKNERAVRELPWAKKIWV